jgi:glutamate 5-kinase
MKFDRQGAGRNTLMSARRIVVKVGSAVLTDEKGLAVEVVADLSSQIAALAKEGREITVVSSGAIAAGLGKLPALGSPKTVPEKQALAAVGQGRLMHAYEEAFDRFGLHVAQALVTREGLVARYRYLNAKNTLKTLLKWGIVPIVNENDTVATEELQFTDNDALSVLVVNLVEAELLVCLSDVDALYSEDPREIPDAKRISEVKRVDMSVLRLAGNRPGRVGRGGMRSKLEAARMVTACGVPMVVAGGRTRNVLTRLFSGEDLGTFFCAGQRRRIYGRKPWIAFALAREGVLELDDGAVSALVDKGKSLLPVGIKRVMGEFEAGACVVCRGLGGEDVAVGLSSFSAEELRRICGCQSTEVSERIGHGGDEEVIHRDNLVIL